MGDDLSLRPIRRWVVLTEASFRARYDPPHLIRSEIRCARCWLPEVPVSTYSRGPFSAPMPIHVGTLNRARRTHPRHILICIAVLAFHRIHVGTDEAGRRRFRRLASGANPQPWRTCYRPATAARAGSARSRCVSFLTGESDRHFLSRSHPIPPLPNQVTH